MRYFLVSIIGHNLIEFLCIIMLEGQSTCQHRIESYSQGPYFSLLRIVSLFAHHLGSGVAGRSAAGRQPLALSTVVAQSEVD